MKKILIVEDEAPVRMNLAELLAAEGYTPVEARDGEEGVYLAWEILPDLILCDINMPKMDGFAVLSRLSRDPATAAIPFIFLSARTEREDLRLGMTLGADDYVTKPFTCDDLMRAISTRLEKRQLIEAQAERHLAELSERARQSLPGQMLMSLSMILSRSEALSDRQEVSGMEETQVCAMGREIYQGASSLLRSIQNYTLFSDLEAIPGDVERLRVLRDARVYSAWTIIAEMAIQKSKQDGREMDLRLDGQDASLQISEMYLQKIIEELLDNAFKFSRSGSPVYLQGGPHPARQQYVLAVRDAGRGMPADQAEVLSGRPGARILPSRRDHGFGLAIVRRLVDLHQGSLRVRSVPGEGTSIELWLPLASVPL